MTGWLSLVAWLALWVWAFSPWVRFAVLPGLHPTRDVPLWTPPRW